MNTTKSLRAKCTNHSYRHTDSSTISDNALLWQNEIANTNDIIHNLIGYVPRLFRPPYGRIRGDQIDYLTKRGMRIINWSIDTRDWHTQVVNQQDIEFDASHYSHPEAVILMHDGGGNRSNSVAALDKIISH
ncbi:polysaccharide deacetylase family protein [Pseudoalteromonas tunicata]|uniref:polysaccharide deacetylase family protein n=1 Tax=Pseudoalteromonas tunicata TaxID=314281 RepID=UPI0012FD0466|nr:polysaccharide deacetylase family protein [Pseudoalteromonas tunicata]